MTPPDLRAGLIAEVATWRKEAAEWLRGLGPNEVTRRLTSCADKVDALLAASPGARTVQCGAHAYTPDATGDCTGCGGGPGSHWGHTASPGAPDAGGLIEDFLRELGSLSDCSIAEADPALLSSYRDDARDLYDALAAVPPQGRDPLVAYVQHKGNCELFRCVWPSNRGPCGLTEDNDYHYLGTVDSHQFQRGSCSCGLALLVGEPRVGTSEPTP